MKKYLALTIGIAALATQAFAQKVDVSLTLPYTMFVTGEPVLVQAKVTNLLRGQLDIGDDAPDTFLIEVSKGTRDNELAPEEGKPFIKPLTLMPGNTLEHRLEVDKWFDLSDNGKYLIRAILVHNGMRYESALKSFDVMPGVPLKKGTQMFVNRPNLERTFQLVHWTRNQTKHLFLRIEDAPSGQVWDTIDLGEFSRAEEPRLDIAPTGEVTTFHRANADSFLRTVIWSLPDSVEVADRDALLDPNVPATKRMRAIYGDVQEAAEKKKSSWWKFW
jgi:hypothetical protein